ncbi:formylglycine-generating enzyme [Gammaproteobacteria bacterium]
MKPLSALRFLWAVFFLTHEIIGMAIDVVEPLPTFINSIGMEFVRIPSGSFLMGNDRAQPLDEFPRHQVTISKPFYLGKYEVTQTQWEAIMESNPSKFKGEHQPVEYVSWDEVQRFILLLNTKERTTAYRLPTEAEWEYAAKAGTTTGWYWGNNLNAVNRYEWYEENSNEQTHPVGKLQPNPWGLDDMLGNVMKWTQDRYDDAYYSFSPSTDPTGPEEGESRVYRGANWLVCAANIRPELRGYATPDDLGRTIGFRVAMTLVPIATVDSKSGR